MEQISTFLENLKHARHHNLEWEWMNSFFESYDYNHDLLASIAFANCEWDL